MTPPPPPNYFRFVKVDESGGGGGESYDGYTLVTTETFLIDTEDGGSWPEEAENQG